MKADNLDACGLIALWRGAWQIYRPWIGIGLRVLLAPLSPTPFDSLAASLRKTSKRPTSGADGLQPSSDSLKVFDLDI